MADRAEIWKAEYFKCLNATEAARRAGYKWPNKYGPELKLKFADEIDAYLKENTLSPQEVLVLLSQQATSEQSRYFTEHGEIDIKKLIADGKGHLIQGIEPTQYGRKIKFYDAQAALVHIGKAHGMFSSNDPGSSDDRPFVLKVVYGSERTNSTPEEASPQTD